MDHKWINAVRIALEHLSAAAKENDQDRKRELVTQAHAALNAVEQQNFPLELIDVKNSLNPDPDADADNPSPTDLGTINTARSRLINYANKHMPFQCKTAYGGKATETIRDKHGLPISLTRDELIKLTAEFQNTRHPGEKIYKNPNARWYHTTAELNDAVIENKDGTITITFINPRIRQQFLRYVEDKWPEIATNRDRLPKNYIQNHKGQVVFRTNLPDTPLSGTVTNANANEATITVDDQPITFIQTDGYTNKETNYFLTLHNNSEEKVRVHFKSDEALNAALRKIGGQVAGPRFANAVNSAPLPQVVDNAVGNAAYSPQPNAADESNLRDQDGGSDEEEHGDQDDDLDNSLPMGSIPPNNS